MQLFLGTHQNEEDIVYVPPPPQDMPKVVGYIDEALLKGGQKDVSESKDVSKKM